VHDNDRPAGVVKGRDEIERSVVLGGDASTDLQNDRFPSGRRSATLRWCSRH
jgi:hypothetical protein